MKRRGGAGLTISISLCWILLLLAALFFGPGMVGAPRRGPAPPQGSAGERLLDSLAPKPSSSPSP